MNNYDVVIIGGGMVGASLALLLKPAIEQGLNVALVDNFAIQAQSGKQPSFDDRTTALSLGTQRILDQLQLWPQLASFANAIEHIQVSQQKQFGRVNLHAEESQVAAFGYVIENSALGQGLSQGLLSLSNEMANPSASKQGGLEIFAPAKASDYQVTEKGAELNLELEDGSKQHVTTDLLVLADGAQSQGCKQLGINQSRHDYGQSAIVCNVSFDQPHDDWAYERFTQTGPLALLPLTHNRYGLVWCMSPELAAEHLAKTDTEFQQSLQKVLGHDKGRLTRIGQRHTYPLNLVQAKEQARSHVVVLGNAAHALHPVAGQGFNLALRDTQALANQLIDQHKAGQSLGDIHSLKAYVDGQQNDQWLTTSLSHLLPIGFTQQGTSLSILRSLGLTLFDMSPTAKHLFSRQTMGLTGSAQPWRP